ncbi:unnamed protein product [Onchocerca flexuosa]|uniref:Uncharacterized protein n=1 Tax=Onchocerca flexuosa TaxID=387005 RepID=A0A183HKA9_9BILA|nr:unnamed protein product [Onchocerca flexuosa]
MDDLSRKKSLSQALQVDYHLKPSVERCDSLQVRLNDMVNKDCSMKSFLREIESKLYIIEKNQQAMLKLLESSVDNEGNSKNLVNTEVVRRNDSIIMERELFTGKRESGNYGIYANISKSDEEEKRKLHCMDELTKTCNVYQIAKRKSFILRDEVYTSITDAIKMPKIMYSPNNSLRTAASPSIFATQLNDATVRNFEQCSLALIYQPIINFLKMLKMQLYV